MRLRAQAEPTPSPVWGQAATEDSQRGDEEGCACGTRPPALTLLGQLGGLALHAALCLCVGRRVEGLADLLRGRRLGVGAGLLPLLRAGHLADRLGRGALRVLGMAGGDASWTGRVSSSACSAAKDTLLTGGGELLRHGEGCSAWGVVVWTQVWAPAVRLARPTGVWEGGR